MEKTKDDVMELMMKRMKDKIKDQKYKMTFSASSWSCELLWKARLVI